MQGERYEGRSLHFSSDKDDLEEVDEFDQEAIHPRWWVTLSSEVKPHSRCLRTWEGVLITQPSPGRWLRLWTVVELAMSRQR